MADFIAKREKGAATRALSPQIASENAPKAGFMDVMFTRVGSEVAHCLKSQKTKKKNEIYL